ncbi:type II toxin-antitoxin system RelE/ParE family toxin [Novosphingobium kaempferiae]|uniref:type II toxin-antitoxin system RelE/ParE family toxin n=1 Tax=Novosphingobium kaempferiae TaxID=2896849 RepID=UPI001E45ABA1|nr:type II toxin-antitoxin system RelE/ParE family toxin [Novosphingobium kaempferiae]
MPDEFDDKLNVLYKGQVEIIESGVFRTWLDDLRDRRARVRINDRLRRLADGHAGDAKPVGEGVQELRLHFGPGYRIYFMWQEDVLVILLNGGDKDSQFRDIAKAREMAREIRDGFEIVSF